MRKHCRNKTKKDTVASTWLKERKIIEWGKKKGGDGQMEQKKWTRGGFSWAMVDNRRKQWDERTQQCASRKALAWYPAIDPRGEGWGYTSPDLLSALNTCVQKMHGVIWKHLHFSLEVVHLKWWPRTSSDSARHPPVKWNGEVDEDTWRPLPGHPYGGI